MKRMLYSLFVLAILLAALPAFADSAFVKQPDVNQFIDRMVKKYHFKKNELESLFSQVKLRPQVIRHVKKPLEIEPWRTYQMLFVNEWRIQHGVKFWDKYEQTLKKAEKIYGVPASIIVATIGVETKYGQKMGDYRVIDSLSSLGFSRSPRAPFFRKELEQFLLLTREQHMDPLKINGSYAGAMGQPQFMPSSYRHYAVNFSGSGKIDLMSNEVDVIGSVANYYKKHGWKKSDPIALQAITVSSRYDYLVKKKKIQQAFTLTELAKYGITPKTKTKYVDMKMKVIELPSRFSKEYWLGFHNFDVIKRYNTSNLYAMAVYQLSNYITALKERLND